jgi:hypothetical protein
VLVGNHGLNEALLDGSQGRSGDESTQALHACAGNGLARIRSKRRRQQQSYAIEFDAPYAQENGLGRKEQNEQKEANEIFSLTSS